MSEVLARVEKQGGMTLLWENPNPTVAFAAQTITLNYKDWDYLLIIYCHRNGDTPVYEVSTIITSSAILSYLFTSSNNDVAVATRELTMANNKSSITFSAARRNTITTGTGTVTTDNNRCVPLKICGGNF